MNKAPGENRRGLVYYMHDGAEAFRFQLAGDLSQHSTRDLEQARQTASSMLQERRLIVDLTDLTSIDVDGSQLLQQWHARGAELVVISADAKARIQSMTNTPITVVGTQEESYKWLLRPATLLSAIFLAALLLATAITASSQWPLFLGARMSTIRGESQFKSWLSRGWSGTSGTCGLEDPGRQPGPAPTA